MTAQLFRAFRKIPIYGSTFYTMLDYEGFLTCGDLFFLLGLFGPFSSNASPMFLALTSRGIFVIVGDDIAGRAVTC